MTIKWNKVTWYSKAIAGVLFVVLPFVGFYLGIQYGKMVELTNSSFLSTAALVQPPDAETSPDALIPYYADPSEWQTDANNTDGGFSIAYPIDFDAQDDYSAALSADWRVDANGTKGVKYFSLVVPRAFEPQTNFADATLTVGAGSSNAAVAQCMTPDPGENPSEATSTVSVNGVQFTVFHSTGVGAGNTYDTTSYRTLHAGRCYAVEYTVHSSQIMNYPQSYDLAPFSSAKIDSLMQNIIGTFRFM